LCGHWLLHNFILGTFSTPPPPPLHPRREGPGAVGALDGGNLFNVVKDLYYIWVGVAFLSTSSPTDQQSNLAAFV